jgi:acetyl-CoA carboxylase biotin carboxyl carrier protein
MDINKIEKLLKLVEDSELEELEIEVKEFGGRAVRVRKGPVSYAQNIVGVGAEIEETGAERHAKKESVTTEESIDEGIVEIVSPIVGTFYRAPAPDVEPFVNQGGEISPGQVVCIVEAMKLMNEIQSEVAGKVEKIHVVNAQPVEFGQVLFSIRKD